MAIIVQYDSVTAAQIARLGEELQRLGFVKTRNRATFFLGSNQVSVFPQEAQIVLNTQIDIRFEHAKAVLEQIVDILEPACWGSDLPLEDRASPPDAYEGYALRIPYDPNIY